MTDANLVLGRLLPDFFPRIFGPNEDQPLDGAAAYTQMQNLTNDVRPRDGDVVRDGEDRWGEVGAVLNLWYST